MHIAHLFALVPALLVSASLDGQIVLDHPLDMPEDPNYYPLTHPLPTLNDLLTIEPSASIWFSYARNTEFSQDFFDTEEWLTLLVPTNKAVMSLGWKPQEGPRGNADVEISEQEFDEQSKYNVRHWVAAHIIPSCVSLSDKPEEYETLLEGKFVTFSPIPDGKLEPSEWTVANNRIVSMKEGSNGVVYMLDGSIDAW